MSGAGDSDVPKILIADDDLNVVGILAMQCRQLGFHVEIATNGSDALLKAAKFKPDVLVVDVHMPEPGGFSIALHLVDDQSGRPINVVAISGHFSPFKIDIWKGIGAICVQKGNNFWSEFIGALIDLCPTRAYVLRRVSSIGAEVRTRSTILLVDDDRSTRNFLANRLSKLGMEPIVAPNGAKALKLATRANPAVIVTDFYMPNGDAEYLLSRLRMAPETKYIPVVVHTGRDLDEHVQIRLRADVLGAPGAAHIVRKSRDAENLFDTLRSLCGFVVNPETHYEKPTFSS